MPDNRNGVSSRVGEYTADLIFSGPDVLNLPLSEVEDWQWDYAIQDQNQVDRVFVPATRDIKCKCVQNSRTCLPAHAR